MPLYLITADTSTISNETKQGIAESFTNIHCGLTFAPPSFVHVYFIDGPEAIDGAPQFSILGNIRADRSDAVKENLKDQMCRALSEAVGVNSNKVSMMINESPGSWTMEGGHLLPEPGEEDAWLERHSAMIAAQG